MDIEDQVIVCQCAHVTLGTIKEVIRLNDLHTTKEITNFTKAGAFCRSCIHPGHEEKKYYLSEILKQTREEMAREEAKKNSSFKSLPLIKQLNLIEDALEAHIRPTLQVHFNHYSFTSISSFRMMVVFVKSWN
jgi:NifU-like protein